LEWGNSGGQGTHFKGRRVWLMRERPVEIKFPGNHCLAQFGRKRRGDRLGSFSLRALREGSMKISKKGASKELQTWLSEGGIRSWKAY